MIALVLALVWIALGAPVRAAEPVIVAFGDSLTAGFGLAPGDAFPAQLERALRKAGVNARLVNAGISGDTTAGGRARIDWVLGANPELVILELGANDALRGIDPAIARANLDAILAAIKARGVKVLLAGMQAPPNLGSEYGRAFAAIFPELAAKHGATLYPFFLDGVAAKPELNQADGLHPTRAGIAVIVERILPTVIKALGGA